MMAKARDIPDLACGEPFAAAARRVVAIRAQEVWDHSGGVLDTADIERVHDMRVATRRLRAVLEIFAPCFPTKPHQSVLRDVKRLADALGRRRDPDVQIGLLEEYAQRAAGADRRGIVTLTEHFREVQAAGNADLAEALKEIERCELRARVAALVEEATP
jgi:CHAD domain-containing protein